MRHAPVEPFRSGSRSRPGAASGSLGPNPEIVLLLRVVAAALAVLPIIALVAGCGGTPQPGMARGRELFETCQPCHGKAGQGDRTLGAPAIAGQQRWYLESQLVKFKGGIRGAHPDDAEGARMRPMARTLWHEGDVASVAEYVASMSPPARSAATVRGGNATAGQARYAVCAACHGPDAKGLQPLNAPALAGQADWYMMRQLDKFKRGLRGAHREDVHGQQMRAMAMTLPDEQAMKDVIAYIRTLARD